MDFFYFRQVELDLARHRLHRRQLLRRRHQQQGESDQEEAEEEEEEEEDDDSKTSLLKEKLRVLSLRVCVRCGDGFSLLFNRRHECVDCSLGVCRKCSNWKPERQAWQCVACKEEK